MAISTQQKTNHKFVVEPMVMLIREQTALLKRYVSDVKDSITIPIVEDKPSSKLESQNGKIFLVHGHSQLRHEVARVLQKLTGEEPIILDEKPQKGRTLIQKFEDHASDASFAVVLMTGDDRGGLRTGTFKSQKPRVRQNVLLELGYFVGVLKRDRVCALYETGIEIPTDYRGVGFIELDKSGGWQIKLAQELAAVKIDADVNKLKE